MRLWLARHAAVVRQDAICYGRLDLVADEALTQAAALHLHRTLPPAVAVRRSPARRCGQLAEALATLRPGLAVAIDPDLQEMDFGQWEGRPWDAIGEPALSAWTSDFATHRAGGGESVQQLLDRVHRALHRERECADALWITHAGVIRAARLLISGVRVVKRADQWPRDEVAFGRVECHALGTD